MADMCELPVVLNLHQSPRTRGPITTGLGVMRGLTPSFRLTEALGAVDVKLTPKHLAALAEAFPPGIASGERYPES